MLLVKLAEALERSVNVDRAVMAAAPQLHDQPLRLAERIGADQNAALRIFVEPNQQPVDLAPGVRVAEDGEAEGRLGDEDVARNRLERSAGRVGAPFVVARDDDPLAAMFEHDLGGTEDVAGGHEADVDLAQPEHLAISGRAPVLRPVAALDDGERLGRRPDLAVAAPRMVGMAVGDERARLRLGRIDPGVRRLYVDAFGKRLYPGTQTGHCELYGSTPGGGQAKAPGDKAARERDTPWIRLVSTGHC